MAIADFALSMATLNTPARYIGIVIFVGATYGVNNIILRWASSVLGETNKKRPVAIDIWEPLTRLHTLSVAGL